MPTPAVYSTIADRVSPHRRYFRIMSVVLPIFIPAIYVLVVANTGGAKAIYYRLPILALLMLVPVHWGALLSYEWFHPRRGTFAGDPSAAMGWLAAIFLTIFAIGLIIGPFAVLAL